MPDCTSSATSRMPCLRQRRSSALQKFRGRGKIAALALNRLDENRGDFLRIDEALEEFLFDVRERIGGGVFRAARRRRRDRCSDRARGKRPRAASRNPLRCTALLAVSESEPIVRPWKQPWKAMNLSRPRVIAGELHRRFDGLGAGIAEIDALGVVAWSDRREFLGEIDHALVIEIRAGHVDQVGGLLLDRGDDVAGGNAPWRRRRCPRRNRGRCCRRRLRSWRRGRFSRRAGNRACRTARARRWSRSTIFLAFGPGSAVMSCGNFISAAV